MSKFDIDTVQVASAVKRTDNLVYGTNGLANSLAETWNALAGSMSGSASVSNAMQTCIANMNKCCRMLADYENAGINIVKRYDMAEILITGNLSTDKYGNVFTLFMNPNVAKYFTSMMERYKWNLSDILAVYAPTGAAVGSALKTVFTSDSGIKGLKPKATGKKEKFYGKEVGGKYELGEDGKWSKKEKKDKDFSMDVEFQDPKLAEASASYEKAAWEGYAGVEGKYGYANVEAEASKFEAHGDAYVGWASAGAAAGISYTAFTATEQAQLGDENFGAHVSSTQTIGKVGAEVEAKAGLFDKNGNFNPHAKVEASAEAIAAEVTGTAGVDIAGTQVNVTGGVNVGVGAHAEFGYEDGKFSADIGASLGVGFSLKFEVDISGTIDAISDFAKSAFPW